MRELIYTAGSPFARTIRILLDEIGLDCARREVEAAPEAGDAPTMQVPAFRDGGLLFWESTLIAEYLLATYPQRAGPAPALAAHLWRPGTLWADKRLLATLQTLTASIATVSQMTWTGVRVGANAHLDRSAARVGRLLGWLEAELPGQGGFFGAELSVQDIALATAVRFAEARPIGLVFDRPRHPRIAALLDRLDERPSFRDNPVRWWDPEVTGHAADGTPLYGGKAPPAP